MKLPDSLMDRDWSKLADALVLAVVLCVAWVLGTILLGLSEVATGFYTLLSEPDPYIDGAAALAYMAGGIIILVIWVFIVYRFARWVWPKRHDKGPKAGGRG